MKYKKKIHSENYDLQITPTQLLHLQWKDYMLHCWTTLNAQGLVYLMSVHSTSSKITIICQLEKKNSLPSSVIWWLRSISFPKALHTFCLLLHSINETQSQWKKVHVPLTSNRTFIQSFIVWFDICVCVSLSLSLPLPYLTPPLSWRLNRPPRSHWSGDSQL